MVPLPAAQSVPRAPYALADHPAREPAIEN
jgi:hypothetical protein